MSFKDIEEVLFMIKDNKVSLWLGYFEDEDEFSDYINESYNEDGDYIDSKFQEDFEIDDYDLDAVESEWISVKHSDVKSLLEGFSGYEEIIPKFEKLLESKKLENYNSILLLYNFEYEDSSNIERKLEFIGCVDVHL